jgi:amidase
MLSGLIFAAALAGAPYPVAEKSVVQIEADLTAGRTTSVAVTQAYLDRIAAIDAAGPALHSVIAVNPHVLADARAADAARQAHRPQGPLAGIPLLIKDNIESADGTATTAGSLALKDNVTGRDAPLVRRLTDAGALILGKTNLSEWANIRSGHSISGWSAVGGLVRNPYALDRSACGSSAGTGAAIAASLAAAGVGTETDGSVTCPSSLNGLVGLKPTVGLVSRTYVVPISHTQDTPGPMARSVADAAILLTAMAGGDPRDPATAEADKHRTDYLAALSGATLKGKRLGVLRYASELNPAEDALFATTLKRLQAAGAQIVDITDYHPDPAQGVAEELILYTELRADLNAYLAATPAAVKARSLKAVIAFDAATPRELVLFGQDTFEKAEQTKGLADPDYLKAKAAAHAMAADQGIDALIAQYRVDALVAPSYGPASRVDVVDGDNVDGHISSIAAVSGYPHLTVPMGQADGLPVGFSFVGPAWSEARLLALGSAFEAVIQGRRPPTYAASVETTPAVAAALAPIR